jgi:acetoin utilization deacetylase AcuC-like enzyme
VSVTLAGGTHHAFPDRGEGYCVFNDVAVAIRTLRAEGRIGPVLVVDLDVHQGNGTAAIFRNDPSVVALDLYAIGNYPFAKEAARHAIPLRDGTTDLEYLPVLEAALRDAVQAARVDLVVYVAGADPYVDDRLGRLALSKEGLADRDRVVFDVCRTVGLPVAVTMGGGYARRVADTVDIHATTVRLAGQIAAP